MTKQNLIREQILQKKEILELARIQLKNEFIGIDTVIDQIIDSVSSWYLFPDMQTKPVIINLWGLTGVGKTAVISRLAELIDFEKKYYRFDLGNTNNNDWAVKNKLEDIYDIENGFPIILALDEFQLARTVNIRGEEMDKSISRIIWDLLDSGKFQISRYMRGLGDLYDLWYSLKKLLRKGVEVKNGKVISKHNLFLEKLKIRDQFLGMKKGKAFIQTRNMYFVPETFYNDLIYYLKEEYRTEDELVNHLKKLDGNQTIDFLIHAYNSALMPKLVDCSKALIFVLGNIDEAYTMSKDFNPDMSADAFHRQSLKINITDIKQALATRFRNEQIARLGNTHIIYPAFSSETFRAIIRLELNKVAERVKSSQNLKISFDESICEMIYNEGVYPTQGTRPVFTTIHQVVNTKLGRVISEMMLKNIKPSDIVFKAEKDKVIVQYLKGKKQLWSFSEKQELNLEKLRKNRKDDMQAINAVHESGHALMAMILLKTIPEMIYSVTADAESNGFVYTSFKWDYISREQVVKNIALMLGGYAAEKIIFGAEKVTTGASGDIFRATKFATAMLKECGMGKFPANFQTADFMVNLTIHDTDNSVNKDAMQLLEEGLKLAEKTIKEQNTLFLKMADLLSDNRFMSKEIARQMLEEYAVSFSVNELIENGDFLFYRNHLKQKVNEINHPEKALVQLPLSSFEVSLNNKKNGYAEKD